MPRLERTTAFAALMLALGAATQANAQQRARNIVFILADDHRYDAMSFVGHPIVQTPSIDRIAKRGVHLRNAFVTTALCSPSRATILTGLYAHQHKVVDNNTPIPAGTMFFPQYLQRAGYQTALVGKWHMGGDDGGPQPGFDHWVSFKGQGSYFPSADGLNVDGKSVPQKGYITDELTDYSLAWLEGRDRSRPFFLYLSHKGVHNDYIAATRTSDFLPAERHRGKLENRTFTPPKSQSYPPELEALRPRWVRDQRNSWHGVDFPYHGTLDVGYFFKRYAETLMGVDDSVGRVLDYLEKEKLLDSTLVIYMGDNGFAFGEHGLIDKRTAYEESMRVPMVMQCPELFPGGRTVEEVVANLDVAPTILSAAGLEPPAAMVGKSLLPLARGERIPWRTELLYEYYWERNYPQTPTVFALRADRYKFIRYQGVWDVDELFDLQSDPLEMTNLAYAPDQAQRVKQMSDRMFALLAETNGTTIQLYPDRGPVIGLRAPGATRAAPFPPVFISKPPGPSTQEVNDRFEQEIANSIKGRESEPAGQVFKNMRIPWLKTTPARQLLDIMNGGYARALGVRCTHCHVENDFSSDDKRPKRAAREMALMHWTVNQTLGKMKDLKSEPDDRLINCATCHRGATSPHDARP